MAEAAGAALSPQAVLDYWFGPVGSDSHGKPKPFWFMSTPEVDADITSKFTRAYEAAVRGELEEWASEPLGRVALIIVLDQFPRNMFRGTPKAFATDDVAYAYAKKGYESGAFKDLPSHLAMFGLMPMQHVESLEGQELSLAANKELMGEDSQVYEFAKKHYDIIKRFGRFPHRNEILGRKSTPEEIEYMENGGDSFGQTKKQEGATSSFMARGRHTATHLRSVRKQM